MNQVELLIKFKSKKTLHAQQLRRVLIELISDQVDPGGVLNPRDDEDLDVHVTVLKEK